MKEHQPKQQPSSTNESNLVIIKIHSS